MFRPALRSTTILARNVAARAGRDALTKRPFSRSIPALVKLKKDNPSFVLHGIEEVQYDEVSDLRRSIFWHHLGVYLTCPSPSWSKVYTCKHRLSRTLSLCSSVWVQVIALTGRSVRYRRSRTTKCSSRLPGLESAAQTSITSIMVELEILSSVSLCVWDTSLAVWSSSSDRMSDQIRV